MLNSLTIAQELNAEVKGNPVGFQIAAVKQVDDVRFSENDIAWCSDKNSALLETLSTGTVIISKTAYSSIEATAKSTVCYLVVDAPRAAFSRMLQVFFVKKAVFGTIGQGTAIHDSVKMNRDLVAIGANVVIEEECVIGDHVVIDHNTVIKAGSILHNNVKIGANCTIGGVGFGYEPNEDGIYEVIPHIGVVELSAFVEIGNNVCIDRAVLGATFLAEHVKVDNLVHIAHGVSIGKNSLVIANAMIAGSVKIGENCWIAPSSSIIQKVSIGDDSLIGMGSVVLKNVEEKSKMAGVPAKKLN